jgi:hypothetical protein
MLLWVASASLVISILSFLLFAISILSPRASATGSFGQAKVQADVEGWAKLAESIAKIIDSLSKAGPSTLSLSSSIVFMVLSFLAAKPS